MLGRARRPVIVAGGGVLAADGAEALRELADALGAPVVMSENGRGAISARHRLAFDALAFRRLREDADLVLAIGTRFVTAPGGQTLPELSTARKYQLATVTVVFNDGYFGNVRRIQRDRFGARYLASNLVNPDYVKLADAFGVASARAEGPAELAAVLKQAIAADEPVLIDAPVGEFPTPWHLTREGVPPPADPPPAGRRRPT